MSVELVYTSIARGLKPSNSGFCTAAVTAGMSKQVITKLEMLSGYEFLFGISDVNANSNPANFAHTQLQLPGQTCSVLSRIGFSGSDYTGRANKIAHHFMLQKNEQLPGGPAWMMHQMAQEHIYQTEWQGTAQELPSRTLNSLANPDESLTGHFAGQWQGITGDTGWAGKLIEAFREKPTIPAFVIFKPGVDMLALFDESLALLPPAERWQVFFSTYYTAMPAGCYYHWRGIAEGSQAIKEISRFSEATIIDLTQTPPQLPDNSYVTAARAGQMLPLAKDTTSNGRVDIHAAQMISTSEQYASTPAVPDSTPQEHHAPALKQILNGQDVSTYSIILEKNTLGMKILVASLSVLVLLLLITNTMTWWRLKRVSHQVEMMEVDTDKTHRQEDSTEKTQPSGSGITQHFVKSDGRANGSNQDSVADRNKANERQEKTLPEDIVDPKAAEEASILNPKHVQEKTPALLPDFKDEMYPREELIDKGYKTVQVQFKLLNPDQHAFDVDYAIAFVKPPAVLAGDRRFSDDIQFEHTPDEKATLEITCSQLGGVGKRATLLTCQLQHKGKHRKLICNFDKKQMEKDKYRQKLKNLVIEVVCPDSNDPANPKSKVMYQCPLTDRLADVPQETISLSFDNSGRYEISLPYAWPKTLRFTDPNEGEVREVKFAWDCDGEEIECLVKLDGVSTSGRFSVVAEIAKFGTYKKKYNLYKEKKQDLKSASKDKASKKKLKDLQDNIDEAFKTHGSIQVVDAWGLRVAEIKLDFSRP